MSREYQKNRISNDLPSQIHPISSARRQTVRSYWLYGKIRTFWATIIGCSTFSTSLYVLVFAVKICWRRERNIINIEAMNEFHDNNEERSEKKNLNSECSFMLISCLLLLKYFFRIGSFHSYSHVDRMLKLERVFEVYRNWNFFFVIQLYPIFHFSRSPLATSVSTIDEHFSRSFKLSISR